MAAIYQTTFQVQVPEKCTSRVDPPSIVPGVQFIIGADNGLTPNRRRAFIWTTNDGLIHIYIYICIYVSFGLDDDYAYIGIDKTFFSSRKSEVRIYK